MIVLDRNSLFYYIFISQAISFDLKTNQRWATKVG